MPHFLFRVFQVWMDHRDHRVSQAAMEQRQTLSLCYYEKSVVYLVVCYHFKLKLRVEIEESAFILQGDRGRDGIPGIPGSQGPPVRKNY